jgi:hypothetical protein
VAGSVTARLEARLDFIGAHCLPGRAVLDKATRVERARIWLLEQGYGELFEPFDLTPAPRLFQDRDGLSWVPSRVDAI